MLPSERYKELAEFLTFHYARLCGALELALSAQAKEELAAAMVRVLQIPAGLWVRRREGTNPGDQGLTDRVIQGELAGTSTRVVPSEGGAA